MSRRTITTQATDDAAMLAHWKRHFRNYLKPDGHSVNVYAMCFDNRIRYGKMLRWVKINNPDRVTGSVGGAAGLTKVVPRG